jgi:hypothetical protein
MLKVRASAAIRSGLSDPERCAGVYPVHLQSLDQLQCRVTELTALPSHTYTLKSKCFLGYVTSVTFIFHQISSSGSARGKWPQNA